MRPRGIKYFAGLASVCLIVSPLCLSASAQNPLDKSAEKSKSIAEKPDESSLQRTEADETFQLNIDERRITKTNFEASTAVDTNGGERGVNVRIGVSLTAGRIDVLLRNVHGTVRFRGTLDRILEVIGKRSTATP